MHTDPLTDDELADLLHLWAVPEPPPHLRASVFKKTRAPWYRRFPRPHHQLATLELNANAAIEHPWANRSRPARFVTAAFAFQIAAIAVLSFSLGPAIMDPVTPRPPSAITLTFLNPQAPPRFKQGGGGGGQLAPTPVSKGAAPRYAQKPFIPPAVALAKPKLTSVPEISAPAPHVEATVYGDPLSHVLEFSPGKGLNGLGDGKGSGVGSGSLDGYGPGPGGSNTGGLYTGNGAILPPVLLSKVDPEYSEEARRAKYSGFVDLAVVIDEQGRPAEIHVIQSPGLGLDEKAIAAVRQWRFRPARRNGKPISITATVHMTFHLL